MATLGNFVSGQVLTAAELNDIGTWTTFTPVFTNFTAGSATINAKYCQINNIVFVRGQVTLAADSSVSGSVSFAHPSPGASITPRGFVGHTTMIEDGGSIYTGAVLLSSTAVVLYVNRSSGTYTVPNNMQAAIPFSWGTNDQFYWNYFYEVA